MGSAGAKSRDDNAAIASWCAARGFEVQILGPVGNGALNQHWLLKEQTKGQSLVFRARGEGHWLTRGFEGEALAMTLARKAGLPVPKVLQAGQEGLLMHFVPGSADRNAVLEAADDASGVFASAVIKALQNLRRKTQANVDNLADAPGWLASIIRPYCLAETPWFTKLEGSARAASIMERAAALGFDKICLSHGDFRTGNLLLADNGLQAVMDWEFAGYRPAEADIGWMLSSPWRYSRPDREASGLFHRGELLDALGLSYSKRIKAWEALALVRWAVIARLQDERQGVRPGTNADERALLDEAEALVRA